MLQQKLMEQLGKWRTRAMGVLSSGQGLVEYALILMFVAMIVLLVLYWIGPTVGNVFSNIIVGL